MNRKEIKKYIYDLGKICSIKNNFINMLFSIIDLCEDNVFMNYIEMSRFESSLSREFDLSTGRFIHYLKFKKNLPLKIRKYAGYISAMRIIKIMKKAEFKAKKLFEIILFCGEFFNVFPNTIISCEWDFKSGKFKKFTLYIVFGKNFNKDKCVKFSKIIGINDYSLIYKLSRNIDFLGLDFFYNGDISLKIYNRFPYNKNFKPLKWENKILDKMRNNLISIIRITRINVRDKLKINKNEKSHFITKGILFPHFLNEYNFKISDNLSGILAEKKIEVISIDKHSVIKEIWSCQYLCVNWF